MLPEIPSVGSLLVSAVVSGFAVLAGVGFGLDSLLWVPAGVMLMFLLALMTLDLVTEFFGMPPSVRKVAFVWEREITGKFFLLALVALSLVLDAVIYIAATVLPSELAILSNGYLFVTLTTLLWLIGAHVVRITTNVAEAEGEEMIPPTIGMVARHIRWLLRSLRVIDERRARVGDKTPEHPKRWYDEITDEEVLELAEFIQRKKADPPAVVEPLEPPLGPDDLPNLGTKEES